MLNRHLALVLALVCACGAASAQTYPQKPIHWIIPFGAGGSPDVIARVLGASMSKELNQQIVVENRPGAGGVIGTSLVARAAPDGYTLVMGSGATHGIAPLTVPDITYDPVKSFQPVTLVAKVPNVIAVHSSLPVKTPAELADFLRKNHGYDFISGTAGLTTTHLAGELFAHKIGVKLTHIPHKSAGQGLTDLAAGRVKLGVYGYGLIKTHFEAGTLRPIAAMTLGRMAVQPSIPTVAETLIPGFEFSSWFGLMAPAGTPRAIVDRLHSVVKASSQSPEIGKQFEVQGIEMVGLDPAAFQAFIKVDIERWREALQASGVRKQ